MKQYTLAQLEAQFEYDATTLRHEAASGRLVATKIGRDWLVFEKDFQTWLKQPNRRKPRPKKAL